MSSRLSVSGRITAGFKLFAVLLAMAALPALTLGQIKPGATEDKKAAERQGLLEQLQKEIQENAARLKAIDTKVEKKWIEVTSPDDKLIRDIEARLAELNKQLEAARTRKPAEPAAPKIQFWTVKPDGKKA